MAGGSKNGASAKGTPPAKGAGSPSGSTPPTWKSPKGRRTKADLSKLNQPKSLTGWYLRSILLDGGVELIMITTSSFQDDAYFNPLPVAIRSPEIKMEGAATPHAVTHDKSFPKSDGSVNQIGLASEP
jgi:hypothetical protein